MLNGDDGECLKEQHCAGPLVWHLEFARLLQGFWSYKHLGEGCLGCGNLCPFFSPFLTMKAIIMPHDECLSTWQWNNQTPAKTNKIMSNVGEAYSHYICLFFWLSSPLKVLLKKKRDGPCFHAGKNCSYLWRLASVSSTQPKRPPPTWVMNTWPIT